MMPLTRTPSRTVLFAALLALAAARVASADVHLLVITGVSGDEDHATQFHRWASTLVTAALSHGVPADHVVYLAERADVDPKVGGRSTREGVARALRDLATRATADDQVLIVLIGHGSYDGRTGAFNLPGPDLSADDYARLLQAIPSQHVAFIDTSSASGAFLTPLAGPGRAIVTATKTGGERNETRFPEYFADAFANDAADRDRDGRVSVREAFDFARAKVAEEYQKKGIILTEHAALEDGSDGAFASTLALGVPASTAAVLATGDPALKALVEERQQLESKVASLRQRKDAIPAAEYDAQLEKLLVELAGKTRAIQQLQGKK